MIWSQFIRLIFLPKNNDGIWWNMMESWQKIFWMKVLEFNWVSFFDFWPGWSRFSCVFTTLGSSSSKRRNQASVRCAPWAMGHKGETSHIKSPKQTTDHDYLRVSFKYPNSSMELTLKPKGVSQTKLLKTFAFCTPLLTLLCMLRPVAEGLKHLFNYIAVWMAEIWQNSWGLVFVSHISVNMRCVEENRR